MTHLELSVATARWLVKRSIANWAVAEPNISMFEMPDVFGTASLERSILCEIKVSRADFLADAKKRVREYELKRPSMGFLRYFVTLGSITHPDEIRPKWGLIEYRKGKFFKLKEAEPFENRNRDDEGFFMIDVIRKHKHISDRIFSTYSKESFNL